MTTPVDPDLLKILVCPLARTPLVQDGDTINYRYSANCTIMTFKVLEIPAAI